MAKTYVVKEKDNLASLSKALGVSIPEIQKANGIRNLTPGQTLVVPSSRSNGIGANGNAGGYSVTTGDNERKTINYNGTDIRLGPNSTFAPKNDKSKFQQFIDVITGNAPSQPSGTTSVRGALPSATKGIPGLAAPTQYQGLGVNSQMGGYQQANQQTYFGSYGQGAPFSANQNALRQQALGLNVPPSQGYQYFGSYGQGAPFSANQNMLRQQALGLTQAPTPQNNPYAPFFNNQQLGMQPNQFSYAPQGQPNSYTPYQPAAPRQFSYAPQGQPNSYTPYGAIQPRPAPFLTAQMLANPTYGNTVAPQTNYGSYANGTAKTAQEAYQQGTNKVGKRWWIGSGKTHGEDNSAALLAAQQAAELAANQAITMNPGNIQQTTWRPIY